MPALGHHLLPKCSPDAVAPGPAAHPRFSFLVSYRYQRMKRKGGHEDQITALTLDTVVQTSSPPLHSLVHFLRTQLLLAIVSGHWQTAAGTNGGNRFSQETYTTTPILHNLLASRRTSTAPPTPGKIHRANFYPAQAEPSNLYTTAFFYFFCLFQCASRPPVSHATVR